MKHVIMAMSKSAWSEGRTGARKEQDWYLVVQEAVRIKKQQGEDSVVVAVTGFTNVTFSLPEIECYKQALLDFDLKEGKDFYLLHEGIDTITQLHAAHAFAVFHKTDFAVVSTKLHVMRIRWLCFWDKIQAKHYTPPHLGIPRREEIVNDIVLTVLFPFIDIFGLRSRFLAYLEKRRAKGIL